MNIPGNSMQPFAWGVIGTGPEARDFTRDLQYVTDRACFVKAVLGPGGAELDDFADDFNVPLTYTDMQPFLEESQVDAVFIAAPPSFRYPYTIRCLQGGIPVLAQAPVALSVTQATMIKEISGRTKTFFMEGMSLRFLPSLYAVLSLLHTKSIGEVISLKASLGGKDDAEDPIPPEGGALLNFGSFPLFLSLFLLGDPETITATGRIGAEGQDESCTCLLGYPGGQYASIECSLKSNFTPDEAVITGDKGLITLHEPWHEKTGGISISVNGEILVRRPCGWEGKGLHYEVSEVLRCLGEGHSASDLYPHNMTIRLASLMEEVRKQLQVGSPGLIHLS